MSVAAPLSRAQARHTSAHRLSFAHLLRSETVKILSLRSTWWVLGIAVALSVGISLLFAAAVSGIGSSPNAVTVILLPLQFTMLVAGILGAIVVTGEYSTGMIRSTLTAEPRRGAVVLAKALVVSLVIAVTTAVGYAIAALVTAPLLSSGLDWSDPARSTIPLALGVVSMVAFTLLGLGFGFLIRAGAGAIAATVGVLFVLPIVLGLFAIAGEGWQWIADAGRYLPSNAATTLTAAGGAGDATVEAALSLAGWVVIPMVLGWVVLRTRDA